MKPTILQQLLLYRYRYMLGFGLFTLALIALMVVELSTIPLGLTQQEMQSAVTSTSLTLSPATEFMNLPYHLLQLSSIELFGLNEVSIKLPSVVLGVLSGIGLLLLLRRWFNDNVSVIAALLAVSNSLFLSSGRTGTALILLLFWSVFLLLFGSLIVQHARGEYAWKVLIGLIVGLALYTPLTIYMLVSVFATALFHPHSRYVLRRYGTAEAATAILLFLITVTPLAIGIWHDSSIAIALLGFPDVLPNLSAYLSQALGVFTSLGGFHAPVVGQSIQPAYSLASLALILLGLFKLLFEHYALRTYAILLWLAILLPVIVLQPDFTVILFLPFTLLMAIGIQTLISEWYTFFPRNPYARVAGLIPLVALIAGVGFLNYSTYFIGYRYSPVASAYYTNDLSLLRETLQSDAVNKRGINVVLNDNSKTELAFYGLLNRRAPYTELKTIRASEFTVNDSGKKGTTVLSVSADIPEEASATLGAPSELVANSRSNDSLRWRVYAKW
jgi:hypothetical protein